MKNTTQLIYTLSLIWMIMGWTGALTRPQPESLDPLTVPYAFIMAVLFFRWCKIDAAQRQIKPGAYPMLVGLIVPIGLPLYLFHSRRPRQALWSSCKAIGLGILLLIVQAITFVIGQWMINQHIISPWY